MTVSEYIFDFLEKKGVKNVFMVSGIRDILVQRCRNSCSAVLAAGYS